MSYAEKFGFDEDMSDEEVMELINSQEEDIKEEEHHVEIHKPHIDPEHTSKQIDKEAFGYY